MIPACVNAVLIKSRTNRHIFRTHILSLHVWRIERLMCIHPWLIVGDLLEIELTVYVDKMSASLVTVGSCKLDDILVLHLVDGKDFFVSFSTNLNVRHQQTLVTRLSILVTSQYLFSNNQRRRYISNYLFIFYCLSPIKFTLLLIQNQNLVTLHTTNYSYALHFFVNFSLTRWSGTYKCNISS